MPRSQRKKRVWHAEPLPQIPYGGVDKASRQIQHYIGQRKTLIHALVKKVEIKKDKSDMGIIIHIEFVIAENGSGDRIRTNDTPGMKRGNLEFLVEKVS